MQPAARVTAGGPVSVVICTRNRPAALWGCLAALANQTRRPDEIVVVDNAALGEKRVGAALSRMPAVRRVHEPRPGIVYARNRGLQEAGGELLAYLDDDCRPDPWWIERLCGAFVDQPHLGACTGAVWPLQLATEEQSLMERRGGFSRGLKRADFTDQSPQLVQAWRYGTGGNMAFRRSVLQSIDGFDPSLKVGEDLDVLFRVLASGWGLRYEPAAAVYHRHVSEYLELRRRLFRWGWAYAAFLTKTALTASAHRGPALREWRGTLGYHLRDRLWPALRNRGDFPARLILTEIGGLLVGGPGYLWGRVRRRA